jgi:3-deoxy-manno-octulosonate cytidylyltransferase (CMP-KDO synthetase)
MNRTETTTASDRDPSRVLIVIPARYGSSRFPGKALADLAGRPLIVRVVENSRRITAAGTVIVATDDERIAAAVREAGGQAELTGDHATGTDRVGEVAARHAADLVVNLQGDEPLLDPADVDGLIAAMLADPGADIGTCAHPFPPGGSDQWRDPNTVKVVTDRQGRALYFSRAPIPGTFPGNEAAGPRTALRHVGIYAFRRAALTRFLALARTPLEVAEGLEQLRALEHGLAIRVLPIGRAPIGVDTPDDLERVRRLWSAQQRQD